LGPPAWRPAIMALRPAVFDGHVLSLDVARFVQSLVESDHIPCSRAGRLARRVLRRNSRLEFYQIRLPSRLRHFSQRTRLVFLRKTDCVQMKCQRLCCI
jgi:hypothetical protein